MTPSSMPRIYYFCYDHQRPTGGQKQMYRHVDLLNKNGYPAFALHVQDGFRLHWFENRTPTLSFSQLESVLVPQRDVFVLPEDLGEKILSFPGRKVITNQGAYNGFNMYGMRKPTIYPYLHPEVEAVLVKSEDNEAYLKFAFPGLRTHIVYDSINAGIFRPAPVSAKKRTIACVPGKNAQELYQVFHLLHARADQGLNGMQAYNWAFIKDKTELQVARILSESLVFFFPSIREGFPNLPLEAMLAGCMVVAYGGGPLLEYLRHDNAFSVNPGDLRATVEAIERIAYTFETAPEALEPVARAARDTAVRYSTQFQERTLLAAWRSILGR